MNIYTSIVPDATISAPLTGRYLAHNGLSARRKAFLAVDLVTGRAQLSTPTAGSKQGSEVQGG